MLAEILGYASVSAVSSLKIEGGKASIHREIDGGREIVSVPYPLVAIVQKGIAKEPRIAAMRGIMLARTKPIKVLDPIQCEAFTEVIGFDIPKPRSACKFINSDEARQLIDLLQNEAKVI
jgi:electron transfer flavoprotein beta subunit